jgi:hypothetical protein
LYQSIINDDNYLILWKIFESEVIEEKLNRMEKDVLLNNKLVGRSEEEMSFHRKMQRKINIVINDIADINSNSYSTITDMTTVSNFREGNHRNMQTSNASTANFNQPSDAVAVESTISL